MISCPRNCCCCGTRSTDASSSVYTQLGSSFRTQVLANGSLLMEDVQKSDSGLFLCRGSNGIATDVSKVVRLTVHGLLLPLISCSCRVLCGVFYDEGHILLANRSWMSRAVTRVHQKVKSASHPLLFLDICRGIFYSWHVS